MFAAQVAKRQTPVKAVLTFGANAGFAVARALGDEDKVAKKSNLKAVLGHDIRWWPIERKVRNPRRDNVNFPAINPARKAAETTPPETGASAVPSHGLSCKDQDSKVPRTTEDEPPMMSTAVPDDRSTSPVTPSCKPTSDAKPASRTHVSLLPIVFCVSPLFMSGALYANKFDKLLTSFKSVDQTGPLDWDEVSQHPTIASDQC